MIIKTKEERDKLSPKQALEFLKEGNKRFTRNNCLNKNLLAEADASKNDQWPFASILSCIDSRASVELIFDQGIGDIFSARIAGNIVNTDIIGSLEFACKLAGSKLIVVLGHSSCGAVKGACNHAEMGSLTELLSKIQPAIYQETETKENRNAGNPSFVANVAEINVKRSVQNILDRSPILREMVDKGEIGVVGGMHELATGKVTFYEDATHINEFNT